MPLVFRSISNETKEKFKHYFQLGHSASSSRHFHIQKLQIENSTEMWQQVLADRSVNPNNGDVHRIFRAWRKDSYGADSGKEMFDKLEEIVMKYNNENKDKGGKAFLQRYINDPTHTNTEQPLVLAIMTPLMTRAHMHIPQSQNIAFVDSTSSLDRFSSPVFIMSTASSAGGIPLGVVVTSGESTVTLQQAFQQLQKIMQKMLFMEMVVLRVPQLYSLMTTNHKGYLFKQCGPKRLYFYVFFIIYKAGGHGCGTEGMALRKLTNYLL